MELTIVFITVFTYVCALGFVCAWFYIMGAEVVKEMKDRRDRRITDVLRTIDDMCNEKQNHCWCECRNAYYSDPPGCCNPKEIKITT